VSVARVCAWVRVGGEWVYEPSVVVALSLAPAAAPPRRCVCAAYSLFLLPRSLSCALVLPRRIACLASCLRLSWPWRQPFLFGRAHRAPPLPPAPPPAPPL